MRGACQRREARESLAIWALMRGKGGRALARLGKERPVEGRTYPVCALMRQRRKGEFGDLVFQAVVAWPIWASATCQEVAVPHLARWRLVANWTRPSCRAIRCEGPALAQRFWLGGMIGTFQQAGGRTAGDAADDAAWPLAVVGSHFDNFKSHAAALTAFVGGYHSLCRMGPRHGLHSVERLHHTT